MPARAYALKHEAEGEHDQNEWKHVVDTSGIWRKFLAGRSVDDKVRVTHAESCRRSLMTPREARFRDAVRL
jgi:hypothetical protein